MAVDIDKLRLNIPKIATALGAIMADEALRMQQECEISFDDALPAVSMTLVMRDDGERLKFTLAIEREDTPRD